MFTRRFVIAGRGLSILALACSAVGVFVSSSPAQSPPQSAGKSPFIGCGKARAAAGRFAARELQPPHAAYLEEMNDTDVLHYALDIEITEIDPLNNTCTITGSNTITIQSKSASLNRFTFRIRRALNILGAQVNGTPVSHGIVDLSTQFVNLDRVYGFDEVFNVTIRYSGRTASEGKFGSIEVRTHSGGIPVVATLSEPYYAYTWWPAKDGARFQPGDNSDKATLELSITVPDNFIVPSNGVLLGVDDLPDNRKRYRWASDYPIATYLVSFAATEYNTWTVMYDHPGGSMPVEFYIYPSLDTPAHRAAWEKVIDMLAVFRTLFGEYPFIEEKYGIYNFPFGGGMEHQTMTGQGGFGEFLTAHELAHQWWGDAVTCKTWNHIWLNEGFATYAEALWAEHKPGSTGFEALKSSMAGKKYFDGGSVYVYDDEVDDLWQIFNGATSYAKGAWVLHMLRHVLGDDNFFDALLAYRAAYEHRAATTEDFQSICETFYEGKSLDWFFQQWVYGQFVPAYTWGWDAVEVVGKHYLLLSIDQTQPPSRQRFTMPIDIVADGVTRVVFNDADPEHFVIPLPAAPGSVAFDPDEWILRSDVLEAAYMPGPPTIVETSPAPGKSVDYLDASRALTITFHTGVNVSEADFSLTGDATGPWPFTLSSNMDVNPVVLDFPFPLLPDAYTLTIGDGVEASDSLQPLDGEVADPNDPASLPSGDGVAGGDAIIRFTVTSSFTPGDFDGDADRELDDFGEFVSCLTGPDGSPMPPECEPGDFDLNGHLDLADFRIFQIVFPGP